MIFALIVMAIIGAALLAQRPDAPIERQNCHQLAATYKRISRDLDPSAPFATKQAATRDASQLTSRVDDLGGCPDEPSLQ